MGVDEICNVFILELYIAVEWVQNPFMCNITHKYALHTEQIAPCEHFHKPTYNPFHEIKQITIANKKNRTVWTSL